MYLRRTKLRLRVSWCGKSVGVDVTWEVRGLVVGWREVASTRTQGVVPVQMSVHEREGEFTNSQTGFILFHSPELQTPGSTK